MIKIALIAPSPPPYGGIASWTKRFLGSKKLKNIEIKFIDDKIIGTTNLFKHRNINIFFEIKRHFTIWSKLVNVLRDKEVKIVHACIPASKFAMIRQLVSLYITKFYKRKFIIHYRCTLPVYVKDPLSKFIFGLLSKKADLIILLNSQSYNFINKNRIRTQKITIPNFIQDEYIKPKSRFGAIKNILYVGGATKEKGVLLIFKVSKIFPKIKFHIVGEMSDEVITLSKNSRVPSNVILYGPKDNFFIEKYYEESDLFLFLSTFPAEGFSNSLLEAMAKGLPCIVSDWASNKSMISNKGGIVLNNLSTASIQKAINRLKLKTIRVKYSNYNIRKTFNRYSEEIVVSKIVKCYYNLL